MATNENVNKVIYGNQTVMDITDTTAEESDVASGEVFYKANGERSVGTLNTDSAVWGNIIGTLSDQTDLQIELNRAYTKTASETSSIDDLDLIPVQKISASSDGRRNVKFRNLKSILKGFFDDIYQAILTFDNTPTVNSDNPVKSSGVYNALMPKVSESLLKSTVGWTGKNRLKIPSSVVSSGIYTVNRNSDGEVTSIVVNGTPSAQSNFQLVTNLTLDKPKILSGCPSGGSINDYFIYAKDTNNDYYYDYGEGVTLPAGTYSIIQITTRANVSMSNKEFYPMLRDASITDDTYEPYHESVEDWYWENNAKTGVHNLMPILAKTSKTVKDVNYSYSNDTVSLSGTTSGTGWIWLNNDTNADASNIPFKEGTYRVKVIGTLVDEAYTIQILDANNNQLYISHQDGNEHEFTIANDINIRYGIYFRASGKVATSSFKIMICLAEDTYEDYTSPAMTNRELTEAVTPITSAVTDCVGTSQPFNVLTKVGKVVCLDYKAEGVEATAYDTVLFKLPSVYRPKSSQAYSISALDLNTMSPIVIILNNGGAGNCVAHTNIASGHKIEVHASWITN